MGLHTLTPSFIDYNKLREGFIEKSKDAIPPSLRAYEEQWEASAGYFFEMFMAYLREQRLEIRFKFDLDQA
ncbi:MAG: hypothetical protein V2A77_04235 [Pseudomonadota bacterium]